MKTHAPPPRHVTFRARDAASSASSTTAMPLTATGRRRRSHSRIQLSSHECRSLSLGILHKILYSLHSLSGPSIKRESETERLRDMHTYTCTLRHTDTTRHTDRDSGRQTHRQYITHTCYLQYNSTGKTGVRLCKVPGTGPPHGDLLP